MTINYESKVEEVVVLSVGCSVSLGRLDKAIKKITIDRSILPTKSLPNHRLNITVFDTLLSKVMVKTFPSSSLSFPSHFFHLSCQPLATKPCNPKQTLLVTQRSRNCWFRCGWLGSYRLAGKMAKMGRKVKKK